MEAAVSSGECTLGMAGVPQGSVHGRLLFPEICLMELQLLASGSPDLEVLGHVLQSLLGAVKGHHNNAALLYQQVRLFSHTKLMYVCEYMLMLHSHLFQETFCPSHLPSIGRKSCSSNQLKPKHPCSRSKKQTFENLRCLCYFSSKRRVWILSLAAAF